MPDSTELRGSIAMYHHVRPETDSLWSVTGEQLRAHVQSQIDEGLRFGPLGDVLDGATNLAAVTFDDASVSVFENAFPILRAMGIRATVFVPLNFVGGMNTYDCVFDPGRRIAVRIMDWAQLRELSAAGWSIQSHGCSHLPLPSLEPAHLQDELARSRKTVEDKIGSPVDAFAYPFGADRDPETGRTFHEDLENAGYRMAFLAKGGYCSVPPVDRYSIPRVPVLGFAGPM